MSIMNSSYQRYNAADQRLAPLDEPYRRTLLRSQIKRLSFDLLPDQSLLCQFPICFEHQLDGLA